MMQKNILFFLLIISIFYSSTTSGQSLKYRYINAEYLQLPSHPFDPSFRTYSVDIGHQEPLLDEVQFDAVAAAKQYFLMQGFVKVPTGGDFSIQVEIGRFSLGKIEAKIKTTTLSDSLKTKVTNHYLKVNYNLPITLTVIDNATQRRLNQLKSVSSKSFLFGQDDQIKNYKISKEMSNLSNGSVKVSNFKYKKSLDFAWEHLQDQAINRQLIPRINLFLKQSTETLNTRHDYQQKSARFTLYEVSKKSEDYEQFQEIGALVECAFSAMHADRPIDAVRTKLQPALDFWLKVKDNYRTDKKKPRAIHQGCLDNLAMVYCWLEDFEQAKKYNEQAATFEKKGLKGARLRFNKALESIQKRLTTNGVTSRHLPLKNGYLFPPPRRVMSAEQVDNATSLVAGLIEKKDGELITGWIDTHPYYPSRLGDNVVFVAPEEVSNSEIPAISAYCPAELKSFQIGSTKYEPQLSDIGIGKEKLYFMEKVAEGRITAYKYYHTDTSTYIFAKKDNGELEKMKKGRLGRLLEDAADIHAKWESDNGYWKENAQKQTISKTPMLDAIKDYNTLFAKEVIEEEDVNLRAFDKN